jgi:LysR family transcriptional regulator, hydrogen peroxide-inducible genes activator
VCSGKLIMEMHQIRYFLAVAKTRNFTRAAELCNVTQPALTRAVQKLEEELGGLLLRREHNLTHLTDFGRLISPHLEQLAATAEAAKSTAKQFLKLENASISLGVMCTVGPARFMSFLAGFRKIQPGCEFTIIEGVPARLADLLLEGRLDVAVMAQPDAFSDRLDVFPLYKERFCVAFPTGHRLQEKSEVSISDVKGETYLRRINCEYRDYLAEQCRERGFSVEVGFQSEREDWVQMAVAAGFGVCFLPEYSPTIPGVQTRVVVAPEVTREVSLVSISGRRFSPVVASFTRVIRGYQWPAKSAASLRAR